MSDRRERLETERSVAEAEPKGTSDEVKDTSRKWKGKGSRSFRYATFTSSFLISWSNRSCLSAGRSWSVPSVGRSPPILSRRRRAATRPEPRKEERSRVACLFPAPRPFRPRPSAGNRAPRYARSPHLLLSSHPVLSSFLPAEPSVAR